MTRRLTLANAAQETRTGDVWLFRGNSHADKAIRLFTNSPVNHVGMVVALDDLPPLLWHAELGASLPDVWTGKKQRGAQLHRLEHAVSVWHHKYSQDAWFRPIDIDVSREMENSILDTVNRYTGRAFPRTGALARRWVLGRIRVSVPLEDIFCAELVAVTYEQMGLLHARRPANWYDPGKFWSGDKLELVGATLGQEVEVIDIPEPPTRSSSDSA